MWTQPMGVAVDETFSKKIDAHVSQVYDWLPWIGGFLDQVPTDPQERKKWLSKQRSSTISPETRKSLEKWYGAEKAAAVTHAEAFQICEYGKQPNEEEIRQLFPMLSGE